MADVSIQYGTLTQIAAEAKTLQSQFDDMQKALKSLVDNLGEQWQGSGKVEFVSAYNNLKPKLSTISSALGGYEAALKGAVNLELTAEKQTSLTFKSI